MEMKARTVTEEVNQQNKCHPVKFIPPVHRIKTFKRVLGTHALTLAF